MNIISKIAVFLDDLLWSAKIGPFSVLAILLIGTGVWFTIKTRFIQIRGFKKSVDFVFGNMFKKEGKADKDGMSSFQALTTAIAAQVGTGNIVGASTAIAVGGPGAVFWMWVIAFLGMAIIFAEATLAQKYRFVDKDGQATGGPVYYIKAVFNNKFGNVLAGIFAVLIIIALGFMGNAVQSNGIASAWKVAFGIPEWIMGIILAILAFLIFAGGMSRIASFTEKVVPVMAIIYIVVSLIVVLINFKNIPMMFHDIFVGAFNGSALAGGALGWTMKNALSKGISRGLFANEAGMGSTPHAHAVAKVDHPADQGYIAMMGVFIDIFVILNLTAFVVISTRVCYNNPSIGVAAGELTGAALAQAGFSTVYRSFGNIFVAIALFFFAFSTIIAWYFFGFANWKYLFGAKSMKIYTAIVSICIFLGALVLSLGVDVETVWTTQDMLNGLMVIPNIIAILALTGVVVKLLKEREELNKRVSNK